MMLIDSIARISVDQGTSWKDSRVVTDEHEHHPKP